MIADCLVYIAAYFLGAVPFSVIIGKLFYKTDVRQYGSGNPGATNTLRLLGPKAGMIVLLLDIFKGVIPVVLCKYLCHWPDVAPIDRMVIAGALAIAGHIFSPFLGFKGGKGVATTVGVFFALEPLFALAVICVFTLVLLLSKYVSLSSITAAIAFTILTLLFRSGDTIEIVFSICAALMIIYKHKANITRLIKGEENRFVFRKQEKKLNA